MGPIPCVNLPPAISLSSFSFSNTTVTLTTMGGRVAAVNGKWKRLFLAHSALARGKPQLFCPPTKRDWQSPTLSSCASFVVSRKVYMRAQCLYAFSCAKGGIMEHAVSCKMYKDADPTQFRIQTNLHHPHRLTADKDAQSGATDSAQLGMADSRIDLARESKRGMAVDGKDSISYAQPCPLPCTCTHAHACMWHHYKDATRLHAKACATRTVTVTRA